MVEAGTAMKQEQGRLLAHRRGRRARSFAPSTSKNSRTPFTDTCMSSLLDL